MTMALYKQEPYSNQSVFSPIHITLTIILKFSQLFQVWKFLGGDSCFLTACFNLGNYTDWAAIFLKTVKFMILNINDRGNVNVSI